MGYLQYFKWFDIWQMTYWVIQSFLASPVVVGSEKSSRWWFQIFLNVHPYLGKIPNLTNIFQLGWNHQPVLIRPIIRI